MMYDQIKSNEEVEASVNKDNVTILDVREREEFSSGHVPGSILIPLGELQSRYNELENDREIYVICRTGNRSGVACQFLESKGYENVYNVLPGMINWSGEIEF